jgi:hypothetical protein
MVLKRMLDGVEEMLDVISIRKQSKHCQVYCHR